jgi:hypothetical protein
VANVEKPFFTPIVLGHNSFFGVDHLSAERGRERAARFSDPREIMKVVDYAVEQGAGGMMMSTHATAAKVTEFLRNEARYRDSLEIYPLLPYVQKYVTAANEKGMLNVVLDSLASTSHSQKLGLIWSGAKGILTKDIRSILSSLIRLELQPFQGLNLKAVFLHDVFTDLALALDLKEIVEFYYEEMPAAYKAQPAFATKNLPMLLEKFEKWGFKNPLVMAHFNKIGFSMNPSREACEAALKERPAHIMAMSSLASGFLKPAEAYEYLGKIDHIESAVVSTSTPQHVRETFSAINDTIVKRLKSAEGNNL